MKYFKLYSLFFVLVAVVPTVFAQPVAEYGNVQLIRDYKMYGATVTSIGNPGANVVLDLSQVQFASLNITANFTDDCASTPYFGDFQKSNICVKSKDYSYLVLNKDSLVKIGQENASSTTIYLDPEVLVVFPMHFQDTYVDKYKSLDGENDGTVTLKYEAYGTLKTQFGTVDNVITIQRGYYHEFYASNPFRVLAQWDASKDMFYYYDALPTFVSTLGKSTLSVYPTIVADELYFANKSDLKNIQVLNSLGQLVLSKKIGAENLDLSALSKGIYLVNVELNGEIARSKIIKK